jgi:putative transposase
MDTLKINLSTVFACQNVGVKQTSDKIWLVSFMDYDMGYFDEETTRLEPNANPFEAIVLPTCPAVSVKVVVASVMRPLDTVRVLD